MRPVTGDTWKSKLYFFKARLLAPSAFQKYREYLSHETMSQEELRELVFAKKQAIVQFAYQNTDFYRQRFAEIGLQPEDIKTEEDWEKIPVLKKDDLKKSFDQIKVRGIPSRYCLKSTTGGSTGVPVAVLFDKRFPTGILGWRTYRWWGIYPGNNKAVSWRSFSNSLTFLSALKNFPSRTAFLNASCITEETILQFIDKFNRIKPLYLHGYVGAIHELARYCLEKKITLHTPAAVSTTSAPLTETIKATIENSLHAPVYNQYGCCECYWLAAQCEKRRHLHINNDVCDLEFLNPDTNAPVPYGEPGKVTLTTLENRVFPLIRYQNEDLGTPIAGRCECGMPFPLMASVKGRVTDMLYFPDGKTIAGDYLTTIFDNNTDIVDAFQVHQKSDYSLELSVVVKDPSNESARRQLQNAVDIVKKNLPSVSIKLNLVEKINHDKGKFRYVLSDVPSANKKPS